MTSFAYRLEIKREHIIPTVRGCASDLIAVRPYTKPAQPRFFSHLKSLPRSPQSFRPASATRVPGGERHMGASRVFVRAALLREEMIQQFAPRVRQAIVSREEAERLL